jgi:hypothetical protein
VFGSYGRYRFFFTFANNMIFGHVGSARVNCTEVDSSVSTLFSCFGASGGAEVLIPELSHMYATG